MKTVFTTSGTCADRIDLEIEDGIIKSVKFNGGCSGNTQGVAKLIEGMDAREAADKIRGLRCGRRDTSCPDQLAKAIEASLAQ